jgi:hypothetical protein
MASAIMEIDANSSILVFKGNVAEVPTIIIAEIREVRTNTKSRVILA